MTKLNDLEMPVALKILVRNPPLLNGESKEEYYALLAEMMSYIDPSDPAEFIWVINFHQLDLGGRSQHKCQSSIDQRRNLAGSK